MSFKKGDVWKLYGVGSTLVSHGRAWCAMIIDLVMPVVFAVIELRTELIPPFNVFEYLCFSRDGLCLG